MSGDGLWKDTLDCGCAKYVGHSCRPLWMTEEEWRGTAACDGSAADSLLSLGGIERGASTGNTDAPDLHSITALSEQDSAT